MATFSKVIQEEGPSPRYIDIYGFMDKNDFVKMFLKKLHVPRNVDTFADILIFSDIQVHMNFFQVISNAIILEIFIFTDLWPKKDLKKHVLHRNVDIYEDMNKNDFSKNNLKQRRFRRNVDIFGYMDKKRFLKAMSIYRNFLRILIYSEIRPKKVFFKVI